MRDGDDAGAEVFAEVLDELEDLSLNRHVERGGRLIGDQQVRLAQQRHGDHDALAHAAGELVRILVEALGRAGDTDLLEHVDGALPGLNR